jgi:hypothetical protein
VTIDPSVFSKTTQVVSRIVAGEAILVPICRDVADLRSVYVVNDVGETVWRLIDGVKDVDTIARAVADEFEVDLEVARADVATFLAKLLDLRLVAPAPSVSL